MSTPATYYKVTLVDPNGNIAVDGWSQIYEVMPDGRIASTYWLAGEGTYVTGVVVDGSLRDPVTGIGYGLSLPRDGKVPPMPPEPDKPAFTDKHADWWLSQKQVLEAQYNKFCFEFGTQFGNLYPQNQARVQADMRTWLGM